MVLFPQARSNAPMTFHKEKIDFLTEVLRRGSTEDGQPKLSSQEPVDSIDSENFDNVNQQCDSPPARSPLVRSVKVEGFELQLEHSTRGQHGIGGWNHAMLLVCATAHASGIWHFAGTAMTSGSTAFLLIYLIQLAIVGVSFAALELTLGQYTSLPVCVIFGRIAPLATGVGYLLLLVRLLSSLFLNLQSRYLVFFYNFMLMTFTGDRKWLDCDSYPGSSCLLDVCDANHVWMGGKCIKETESVFTSLPKSAIADIYTRSDASVNFSPSHIYFLELSQSREAALFLGDMILLAVAGLIAFKGNKFFGKLAPIFVASTLFGILVIGGYSIFLVIFLEKFHLVMQALKPQWSRLTEMDVWLHCAMQVLFTIGLGDGTLITVGSQADFRNNILKEVTIMTFFGAGIRILATIAAVFLAVASKQASSISFDVLLDLSREVGESFWFRLPFTLLPELDTTMVHRLCTDIFYLSMVISVLGFQVITIEIFVAAIYRSFSQLLHLPSQWTRHVVVTLVWAIAALILGVSYQFRMSLVDDYFYNVYYLELFTILCLYQIIAILGVYGTRRLYVNAESMIDQYYSPRQMAVGGKIFYLTWTVCLPIYLLAMMSVSGLHKKYFSVSVSSFLVSLMSAIPLVVAAHFVTKSVCESQRVYSVFQTHPKWGPLNIQNRRKALKDEMAARIYL